MMSNKNFNDHPSLNDFVVEDFTLKPIDTPLHAQAHQLSDEQKIKKIEAHFAEIMHTLGLDLEDDSLKNTPRRVAKMYVQEVFSGLNPKNKPSITNFENIYGYRRMVLERDIPLQSTCEHHFQPITGVVHIAYIPKDKVVGLSKLNRIVEYYARRPQVQERLTLQIAKELQESLETEDVAVYIKAKHACVEARGVKHHGCNTITFEYTGKFMNERVKRDFLDGLAH